jgi:single-stranded DNA-binding protein
MDLNIVIVSGRLAATPETIMHDSGSTMTRLLVVTNQTEPNRRVDVIPVTVWDDAERLESLKATDRVHVVGSVHRFWGSGVDGRRNRLEIVANHVELLDRADEEES